MEEDLSIRNFELTTGEVDSIMKLDK
jgi:hypothetical protein